MLSSHALLSVPLSNNHQFVQVHDVSFLLTRLLLQGMPSHQRPPARHTPPTWTASRLACRCPASEGALRGRLRQPPARPARVPGTAWSRTGPAGDPSCGGAAAARRGPPKRRGRNKGRGNRERGTRSRPACPGRAAGGTLVRGSKAPPLRTRGGLRCPALLPSICTMNRGVEERRGKSRGMHRGLPPWGPLPGGGMLHRLLLVSSRSLSLAGRRGAPAALWPAS